jgi:uncharacterized membrane protein
MPAAQSLDTVLVIDHLSAVEVSKMLAWTTRVLMILVFGVVLFWAFSSIAISATGGTPTAERTTPVVVPSPERP